MSGAWTSFSTVCEALPGRRSRWSRPIAGRLEAAATRLGWERRHDLVEERDQLRSDWRSEKVLEFP